LALSVSFTTAYAQPSAKVTAQFRNLTGVNLGADWTTVFKQLIKTPTAKDLFISASFEVGMTTNTAVMSKKLERAIANAEAKVEVRVIRDHNYDQPVEPGEITYAWRKQTLVAEFAGLYDLWDAACVKTETDPDTGAITSIVFSEDAACFDAEYLQLILSTMNANSFNFIDVDVPQGTHSIEVQVRLTYHLDDGIDIFDRPNLADDILNSSYDGSTAWIGKGSVTVESVRMIKDDGADQPPDIPVIE
jgi:hypothetical protein